MIKLKTKLHLDLRSVILLPKCYVLFKAFLYALRSIVAPPPTPPATCRRSSLQSADGVTEKSTADYICYTLHEQNRQLKLAAVVIEAKADDVCVRNAIAQLMG